MHDERLVLLLGLLESQQQHGYQINEFLDRNLGRLSRMPKATAYSLLARLEAEGLITSTRERQGNRPERKTYAITEQGAAAYRAMLREILATVEQREPPADHALMFIDSLPRSEAECAIAARLVALDQAIVELENAPSHEVGIGVDLAMSRRTAMLRADRAWFASALERVRTGMPEVPAVPTESE